jgi:hypothetical protein
VHFALQDGGRLHLFVIHVVVLASAIATGPPPLPAPPQYSVVLSWTAPQDDGRTGRGKIYDLRYSTTPLNEANFQTARRVPGLPAPSRPGAVQSAIVEGLLDNTIYYFALKTRDDAGNWSALSNVVRYPTITTGVGDSPLATGCSLPWPNPARSATRFALGLPEAAEVQADVFSVSGRHVRSLVNGPRPAGRSEVEWDLRDGNGERVAAGIYLLRVRLGERIWSRRVTVIR